MKEECGEGEGPYLSEVEPAASESEDGYGPSSQRYTTADSLASSPASSQFSICGEDQEAVQAQKIWKKAIMLVWRAAANHRYASVFLQSVSDDIALVTTALYTDPWICRPSRRVSRRVRSVRQRSSSVTSC
ncbi:bromodomain-containing protein 8-like [Oncorhynchus tshawytscha]|uniref:bromodomain-containing protein 8-like n=1 Tax=Oncorhynchus tshawytscha TaxID=74940 RepID=UPI001C3DCAA1|nr:bromodomain-containing protein 8-like [Oncorhynchus tshawytscha]